jgi:hypothetical protein
MGNIQKYHNCIFLRLEVLTAASVKFVVFSDMILINLCPTESHKRNEEFCCLHPHGENNN